MTVAEVIKKALLAGLGAQEKAKEFIDELVKAGELSKNEGATLVKEWAAKAEESSKDMDNKLKDTVAAVFEKLSIPSRDDLERVGKSSRPCPRGLRNLRETEEGKAGHNSRPRDTNVSFRFQEKTYPRHSADRTHHCCCVPPRIRPPGGTDGLAEVLFARQAHRHVPEATVPCSPDQRAGASAVDVRRPGADVYKARAGACVPAGHAADRIFPRIAQINGRRSSVPLH